MGQKLKVIAYSATAGDKIFHAHDIFDESKISAEDKADLIKRKFIREATKDEVEEHSKAVALKKKEEESTRDLV